MTTSPQCLAWHAHVMDKSEFWTNIYILSSGGLSYIAWPPQPDHWAPNLSRCHLWRRKWPTNPPPPHSLLNLNLDVSTHWSRNCEHIPCSNNILSQCRSFSTSGLLDWLEFSLSCAYTMGMSTSTAVSVDSTSIQESMWWFLKNLLSENGAH